MTTKTEIQEQFQDSQAQGKKTPEWNKTLQILENENGIYRQLIEHSNDAVSIGKDGRRVFANKKFLELFGYENLEEVLGKPLTMVVHPDDHQMVHDYNRGRLKGEKLPSRYDFKGIRKNGEQIYIKISTTLTFVNKKPILLAFMRDITERIKLEKELLNTKKVDPTGILVRDIAHDFNNLLSIVLGNIAIAKEIHQSGSRIESFLNEAESAGRQVSDLIKKLSSFSK